jgi:glycine/D-amino acid oxidase-like deaminating enzyme
MAGLIGMTVVGGGVVGCFIAYRRALEGIPVTLIERQHVGAGASGASAGNVQPGEFESALGAEDLNPLEAESLGLFRRFLRAMGAWTGPAVSQWLGISVPISPHSLQKLHVRPAGAAPACAVRWGDVNIVPRLDGLVHVGSKHDEHGFEAYPTEDGKQWLLARLRTILPGLEMDVAEAKAGLAACNSGRIPILGPIPELAGVYLAVPSSNGFLLSAALAHMLMELLVHGRHHPFLSRILPERVLQSPTPT